MLIEILATILGLVWLALADGGSSGVRFMSQNLVDMVSLVAILLLTAPIFFRKGMWKDFTNAVKLQSNKFSCSLGEMKKAQYAVEFMQKQLLYAGVVTLIYGLVSVLNSNASSDIANYFEQNVTVNIMGICIAIVLLCPLYTAVLELLILPLEIGIKRRIADYMEEE